MMDAREEILYTYTAAADDRPVGKYVEEIVLYLTLDVSKGVEVILDTGLLEKQQSIRVKSEKRREKKQ